MIRENGGPEVFEAAELERPVPGHKVLIHGGAGGVGHVANSMAASRRAGP